MRGLKQYSPALLLAPLALILCMLHWWATLPMEFLHDRGGRTLYIRHIAENFSLPGMNACNQCMHPPLYHVMAAFFWHIGEALDIRPMQGVALLSLAFYGVYMYYAWRLIRENLARWEGQFLALAIVYFWPLGFHMARNISNDVPVMMAQTALFYYAYRWWKDGALRDLLIAIGWTALALHFKHTAVVSVVMLGAMLLVRLYQQKRVLLHSLLARGPLLFTLLCIVVGGLSLARNMYYYHYVRDMPVASKLFRFNYDKTQYLGNTPSHYLSFDVQAYFTRPYYNVFSDKNGRQSFWNTMLKTSLFDEFRWKPNVTPLLLSYVQLAMIAYLFYASFSLPPEARRGWGILGAVIGYYVVCLIGYRIFSPVASAAEYRYIFAMTPIFALLYAKACEQYRAGGQEGASRLGAGLGLSFALLGILFILEHDLL